MVGAHLFGTVLHPIIYRSQKALANIVNHVRHVRWPSVDLLPPLSFDDELEVVDD